MARKTRSDKGKKRGSRRRSYRRRGKARGKKRHTMGIGGRVGAVVAGIFPLIISGVDVAMDAAHHNKQKADIPSIINKSFLRFVNNLGMGFLGGKVFKHEITMNRTDGSTYTTYPDAGVPAGTLWSVVGIGLSMVVVDRAISFINGGRGVNIPGTHYKAIGN